jgi:Rad3-related DNA helicase
MSDADAIAAEFGGADPIDAASAEIHRRTLALLELTNLEQSEGNYLAAAEVISALDRGKHLAARQHDDLDRRLAFADATSRIAIDRLGSDYGADEYAEMLMTVERELRPTLDDYDTH